MSDIQISFDGENKIRLLDANKMAEMEGLEQESTRFVSQIRQFTGAVQTLTEVLDEQVLKCRKSRFKFIVNQLR